VQSASIYLLLPTVRLSNALGHAATAIQKSLFALGGLYAASILGVETEEPSRTDEWTAESHDGFDRNIQPAQDEGMTTKEKLDLKLVLPDVNNQQDACLERLQDLLHAKHGIGFCRK
jgi:hypothetical protein